MEKPYDTFQLQTKKPIVFFKRLQMTVEVISLDLIKIKQAYNASKVNVNLIRLLPVMIKIFQKELKPHNLD